MNGFCMKRHFADESDFQAPLRKRRYVPSGQIVPLDRKRSYFLPSNSTYEMNPVVAQQMREYDMIRRSNGNGSGDASLSLSTPSAGSDMSMALVVYKRPDLVTPINVNDVDEDDEKNKNSSKNKKRITETTSYPMASPFSSPTFSSAGTAMGLMSSSPSSSFSYGGYSSSSDGSDMELD